ncbi:MAG: deoxyribodipyrimidine photo-lyase [Proteobacteria bacterium]|nr:deoxyribodipyrimidine photo-lyase [Pseudomonadota bacterium]
MNAPVIVWFRHDLRLADHPALHAAVAAGSPVLCLYIHDDETPEQWRAGAASRWWLHHSLTKLGAALEAKGASLCIRQGRAEKVLMDVVLESGAKAVHWNRAYEPYAVTRDTNIKAALKSKSIDAQSFKGTVLFEPWEIKTGGGTPFRVFTPFYKACLGNTNLIGGSLAAPKKINGFACAGLRVDDLKFLPSIPWDRGFADVWEPGEHGAWTRLRDFIEGPMKGYKVQRDFPNIEATSRLSAHLHFGEISHRDVWNTAMPHGGSAPFLRELAWREFSISLLHFNPALPREPLQPKFANFPWVPNDAHLSAWKKGMTGFPIVDAGMKQLWQTGWMHNRVRMIVGSFLVKHLLQPWQEGEAWFWDTLVDADLANNAASWQWIAGCGADAAPYFRVFNPILQGVKFDPEGLYVRHFVPELRDVPTEYIHTPWEWVGKTAYPAPIVDHAAGRTRALDAYAKLKNNET